MKITPWLVGAIALVVTGVAWAQTWAPGDKLEIKWGDRWYPGEVIEVKDDHYKVRYDGYSESWDEWATTAKLRNKGETLAASMPKAQGPAVPGAWKAGDRVEAKSYGSWYPATVLEAGEAKWKVTYDGYSSSSDEWLPAEKIQPLRTASWQVGDRVEALSYGKWYPGKIVEVESARWKVDYDQWEGDEWFNIDRLRAPGATTSGGSDPQGAAVETLAFPARPAGAEAGIGAAFLRVESVYWGGRLSLNNEGWFFTEDGRFSESPAGGFDLDAFATAAASRKTDGTYWIEGDTITLAWADGSPPTVRDFSREEDDLELGGLGAIRVHGFPTGWRFDGVYEGGASIAGMASSNTLVFRRDGTIAQSSIGTFSTTSESTTVSGGSQGETVGTYAFDGFTLTLNLNDGGETRYTVFAFGEADAAGRPNYIYRDGTMMKRWD